MNRQEELQLLFERLSSGSLEKMVYNAILKLETNFLDLQKNQWYNTGMDSEGQDLGVYSPTYELRRKRRGLRTDHVTLKYSGNFFASLRLVMKGDAIYIESKGVDYEKYIVQRYGEDIYDLNDQQRAKLIPQIVDIVLILLRNYLKI